MSRSRFTIAAVIATFVACGGSPREASRPVATKRVADEAPGKLTTDPDLARTPPKPLLEIDWPSTVLASDADALALWKQIAPTGEDWEAKLDEIPEDGPIASQLALALLRGGNFTCVPAPGSADPLPGCPLRPPVDIAPPLPTATLDDPCLRRMLALWAIAALDEADLAAASDALRAIAAIPPPESQLVAATFDAYPASEQDARLELRAIAMRAGHRELANTRLGDFDDAHLVEAVTKHHIDGALDLLTAHTHRKTFLDAVANERLHADGRTAAITELVEQTDGALPRDLRAALVSATRSADCAVAAVAARALVGHGERAYGPVRPRGRRPEAMMRALCVLASFESLQQADEPSYLLGYVPPKGLELVRVSYDPYNDVDTDGDGDPHTERTLTTVPRNEVVLPEIEDLIRAFRSCTGTTCRSEQHEFRFGLRPGSGGALALVRLEVIERPPCPAVN